MLQHRRTPWISGLIALFLYSLMISLTIPHLVKLSGGLALPDMSPLGYQTSQIQDLLTALGQEGRRFYLQVQLPLDFLYPAAAGLMFASIIQQGLLKTYPTYKLLLLLPLVFSLSDYLENLGTIHALVTYPSLSPTVVHLASLFSVIKSVTLIALLLLLLVIGGLRLGKMLRDKKR